MAGNPTSEVVWTYRPCWEAEEVEQMLDSLARLNKRTSKEMLRLRRHERKPYVATVLVAPKRRGITQDKGRILLPVVSRDLSRSGIGLMTPMFFEPEAGGANQSMLRAVNIFREATVLDFALKKDTGETLWLYGTVMRVCTVQHDFLDVGIQFNGRRDLALDFDFI